MIVGAQVPTAMLVPFHSVLDAWCRYGGDEYLRRLNPPRHLVGVGIQVGEELLPLIAGPDRRVAGASAPATARERGRDAPAAMTAA
jgi:hypothetical protein